MKRDRFKKKTFFSRLLSIIYLTLFFLLIISSFSKYIPPSFSIALAFLGLLFPFLYLMVLILSVLRIRKRGMMFWLSVLTLIVTFSSARKYWNPKIIDQDAKGSLKVMSYNVRVFDLYNWSDKGKGKDKIIDFVAEESPDIVCFQEYYSIDASGVFETTSILEKKLKTTYHHSLFTHFMNGGQKIGLMTFSKFPIVNEGDMIFSSDDNNACSYIDVKINDDTLRVFNYHLASIRFQEEDYEIFENPFDSEVLAGIGGRMSKAFDARQTQSIDVKDEINTSPHPFIVCGDLNDTPASYAYRTISKGLKDSFVEAGSGSGSTYQGRFPAGRIDYVLGSIDIQFESHITKEFPISDHKPIVVTFDF